MKRFIEKKRTERKDSGGKKKRKARIKKVVQLINERRLRKDRKNVKA